MESPYSLGHHRSQSSQPEHPRAWMAARPRRWLVPLFPRGCSFSMQEFSRKATPEKSCQKSYLCKTFCSINTRHHKNFRKILRALSKSNGLRVFFPASISRTSVVSGSLTTVETGVKKSSNAEYAVVGYCGPDRGLVPGGKRPDAECEQSSRCEKR